MKASRGFSLVELLIVVGIIAFLMALYSSTLNKALKYAKAAAGNEGKRQSHIGKMADGVHGGPAERHSRDEARAAYRRELDTGKGSVVVTELLYVVETDAEFLAYWNTLINPAASAPLEYGSGGSLIARDPDGNAYELLPAESAVAGHVDGVPLIWDYLSTNAAHMNSDSIGVNVLYNDGHVDYLRYPGAFPATRMVAELSELYMQDSI